MYNQYNLEAGICEEIIKIFKKFLYAENITKGSIRSYLSDTRQFLNWHLSFLKKNHVNFQNWTVADKKLQTEGGKVVFEKINFLKQVNQMTLDAYKNYLTNNNTPQKSINRRFSSLRRFGSFCLIQKWSTTNTFDTLKNVSDRQPFPENVYHLSEFKAHLWKKDASKITSKNYLSDIRKFLDWNKTQRD